MRFRTAKCSLGYPFRMEFPRKIEHKGETKLVNDGFNRWVCISTALESSIRNWQSRKLTSSSWSIARNFLLHSILHNATSDLLDGARRNEKDECPIRVSSSLNCSRIDDRSPLWSNHFCADDMNGLVSNGPEN
jgi:hypothetical protein